MGIFLVVADFGPSIAAAATSIAGLIAALVKDRSDRKALESELAKLKDHLGELQDAFDRYKGKDRSRTSVQGPDPALLDVQRQVASIRDELAKVTSRIDERDIAERALQRELGGIGAKIEILLSVAGK